MRMCRNEGVNLLRGLSQRNARGNPLLLTSLHPSYVNNAVVLARGRVNGQRECNDKHCLSLYAFVLRRRHDQYIVARALNERNRKEVADV